MAALQVAAVDRANVDEMLAQQIRYCIRKHRDTILAALAVAYDDFAAREFDVLHAQANAFHDAQARAVQQSPKHLMDAVQVSKDPRHFVARQHNGHSLGGLRPFDVIEPRKLDVENFAIEEEERALCLILRSGRYRSLHGEICEEALDFARAHLRWMALVVEEGEASNPVDLRLFGPDAVVL